MQAIEVSGLTAEEVDLTAAHLARSEITDVAVARTLKKLPDGEDGAGSLPVDWRPFCHKCGEEMQDGDMVGTAFGHFYHGGCVPSLAHGPMPLGQLLGGVPDAL